MRIASLLASATEMVCALGLDERLVAISHECDYPPEVLDRPRVTRARFDPERLDGAAIDRAVREALAQHGSVYEVDRDQLRAARPDLILTQGICKPPARSGQSLDAPARLRNTSPTNVWETS
jgi:iron complex transport system substrate-binding protein